jgi:putative membrane protein
MRVFVSSALTVLALTSAIAQPPDRSRGPAPPGNPGAAAPGTSPAPGAKDQNAASVPAPRAPNAADQTFITRATRGGLAEVEMARLAEQKAGSQSVREFARKMIADHEQTNRSLHGLAESDGASAPDQLDAENRQTRDALGHLSGAEFDIEYLRLQVQAHQRMAQLMEYVIGSGADPQVQRFASTALPKVFTHLAMAQQLLDQTSMQSPQVAGQPPRKASGMPTPQTPRANAN